MQGVNTGQFDSTFQVAKLHVSRVNAVDSLFVRRSLRDAVAMVVVMVVAIEMILRVPMHTKQFMLRHEQTFWNEKFFNLLNYTVHVCMEYGCQEANLVLFDC